MFLEFVNKRLMESRTDYDNTYVAVNDSTLLQNSNYSLILALCAEFVL